MRHMNNIKERIKIFSGAKLKYIAFASMLIDHFNKAIIYPNLDDGILNRMLNRKLYPSDDCKLYYPI